MATGLPKVMQQQGLLGRQELANGIRQLAGHGLLLHLTFGSLTPISYLHHQLQGPLSVPQVDCAGMPGHTKR
jgi:hypothetical protein